MFFFWLVVVILVIILLAFIVHWAGGGVLHLRLGHIVMNVGFPKPATSYHPAWGRKKRSKTRWPYRSRENPAMPCFR